MKSLYIVISLSLAWLVIWLLMSHTSVEKREVSTVVPSRTTMLAQVREAMAPPEKVSAENQTTRNPDACDALKDPREFAECEGIPVMGPCDLPQKDRLWFREHPQEAGPLHDLGVVCPGDSQ